ncbi:Ig-like domain-containing protein, partial [Methylobacterium sp. E-045]|uniref:Ig-like domain-containing protein n=1 Tax=Methylobacterium sp. E-045 TaxID=2836575 RepID=UPI001FB99397
GGDGIVTTPVGPSFDSGRSVTVQADGRILVAGYSYNGSNDDFALVRYNADGTLDTGLGGGAGSVTTPVGPAYDMRDRVAVQSDCRIRVAGYSYNGSNDDFALGRYNADGIVTTPVGPSFDSGRSVTVQADGRILVAGYSYNGSNDDFALVRYNADGTLDTGFGGGDGIVTTPVGPAYDIGDSVTVQADGRILVAGYSYTGGSNDGFALVRYNADGSLDTGFGGGDGIVTTRVGPSSYYGYSVTVQADGRILVAGYSYNGSNGDFALVRYNADGSLDTSFDARSTLGGTVAYTENGPAVVLDADVDVTDTVLDTLNGGLGDYSGASLTLARSGGADAQDRFAFAGSGVFSAIAGLLIDTRGNVFATATQAGGQLTIDFTGTGIATAALVDAVARAITYSNTSNAPSASVAIDWSYASGAAGGNETTTGTSNVAITAVNDAPAASPSESMVEQRTAGRDSDFLFSDPDGDALTLAGIDHDGVETLVAASGTTTVAGSYGTLTVQSNGRFQYTADKEGGLAVGETQTDVFTFTMRDPGGLTASSTYKMLVTGSATGDAGDNIFLVQDADRAIDGGTGTDTVSFERLGQGVTVTLDGANAGIVTVEGAAFGTLRNVENLVGTDHADRLAGDAMANTLSGGAGNDVLEGGGGADLLDGGLGINTASYAAATAGVTADLSGTVAGTGDAAGDTFTDIQNLTGSIHSDILIGDGGRNILSGNGGADSLSGGAGDDRLVITSSPTLVDGGADTDLLFVQGGGTAILTDETFQNIEKVYVRNGATLDMSGVGLDPGSPGSIIVSQSTVGQSASITGSQGADRISGGKGGDRLEGGAGADRIVLGGGGGSIDGGTGADKLFGGAGADTFHFAASSGRDNVYRFTVGTDFIDVSAFIRSHDDIRVAAIHGGQDTLVTFVGDADSTHKIILHDVVAAALTDASFLIAV